MSPHPGKTARAKSADTSIDEGQLPPEFDQFSEEARQAAVDALRGCEAGAAGGEDCMELAKAAATRVDEQMPGGGEARMPEERGARA